MAANHRLADLAVAFYKGYSRLITERLGHDLPRDDDRIFFTETGYRRETPGDVRWQSLPFYALDQIWLSDGAEDFATACRDELALPRNVVNPGSIPWEHAREFVIREALAPLGEAFRNAESLRPTDEGLLRVWRRWEAHWRAADERHRIFVVLHDVELAQDLISISDTVVLQRLDASIRQDLWRDFHAAFDILSLDTFSRSGAVLRVDGTEHRPRGTGAGPEIDVARRAISALRLVVPGDVLPVGIIHTVFEPAIAQPSALVQFQGAARPLFRSRSRRISRISPSDATTANEILLRLSMLAGAPRMEGLELALRRFEQAYLRDWDEDVIVDLTIALESTLLVDVEYELRYRVALRGAALLSKSHTASETKRLLGRLYDVRSKIVHEGVRLQDIAGTRNFEWLVETRSFVSSVEDLVRPILCAFVQRCAQGATTRDVCKQLEDQILSNLK